MTSNNKKYKCSRNFKKLCLMNCVSSKLKTMLSRKIKIIQNIKKMTPFA